MEEGLQYAVWMGMDGWRRYYWNCNGMGGMEAPGGRGGRKRKERGLRHLPEGGVR